MEQPVWKTVLGILTILMLVGTLVALCRYTWKQYFRRTNADPAAIHARIESLRALRPGDLIKYGTRTYAVMEWFIPVHEGSDNSKVPCKWISLHETEDSDWASCWLEVDIENDTVRISTAVEFDFPALPDGYPPEVVYADHTFTYAADEYYQYWLHLEQTTIPYNEDAQWVTYRPSTDSSGGVKSLIMRAEKYDDAWTMYVSQLISNPLKVKLLS